MNSIDKSYKDLLRHILKNGIKKEDRTGTGTISIFDYSIRFNMKEGFPLLTSKKMYMKGVIHELIWFLSGDTNIKYLVENDVHIWDGDAYKNYLSKVSFSSNPYDRNILSSEQMEIEGKIIDGFGSFKIGDNFTKSQFIDKIKNDELFAKRWGDLGPVYGKQWRNWNGIDQIKRLIDDLKSNPDSRRLMVNAWNVNEIDKMTLPPCHYGFQCYTHEMTIDDRVNEWCESMGKSIYYGDDMTHDKLDSIGFPKRKLSLKWTQRSCDAGLGIPFNLASYGLLLLLLSKEVNMIPHNLIFSGGDCHIYLNHIEKLKLQLSQKTFKLPKIELNNDSLFNLKYDDIKLIDYNSSPSINMILSN